MNVDSFPQGFFFFSQRICLFILDRRRRMLSHGEKKKVSFTLVGKFLSPVDIQIVYLCIASPPSLYSFLNIKERNKSTKKGMWWSPLLVFLKTHTATAVWVVCLWPKGAGGYTLEPSLCNNLFYLDGNPIITHTHTLT